ncbi:MAG: AraC family transcriptional regulator [Bacteroidaceae bacterium]|nr:AraC family transcriptional regulator [Bacteroidaceae bacterium]
MNQNENIYTLSLLRLLSEGKLDPGRGKFYDNQCFVMVKPKIDEVEEGKAMFLYPTRLDCFVILLCDQGQFTLTCNLQQITIQAGTVFYAQPGAILQVTDIRDCRTSVLLFGEQFMRQINLSIQSLLPHIGAMDQLYTLQPEPETFRYMWRQIELVAESISQPTTLAYYHETVRNTFRAFGYTFISHLVRYLEQQSEGHGRSVHNHEEDLFRRFISLVGQHYRTERRISFYAEQMHLTPKYLSTVIRRASGHGPAEWITHNVLLEAKNLLHYSTMSVQEISYALHFPNQSFFGRWFKAQAGLSPKAYRDSK